MAYREFVVEYEVDGGLFSLSFATERLARMWINSRADGSITYTLTDRNGVVVRSSLPVLLVA